MVECNCLVICCYPTMLDFVPFPLNPEVLQSPTDVDHILKDFQLPLSAKALKSSYGNKDATE